MKSAAYYHQYENRTPYAAQQYPLLRVILFQFFGLLFTGIGLSYISWRWLHSLNPDALWFSLPLAVAETFMFFSSILMVVNSWEFKTLPIKSPVRFLAEIDSSARAKTRGRPLKIDVFIATYNEERAIVEDTIRDAKSLKYPFDDVPVCIHLCDDGQRDGRDPDKENFKLLAKEYGINYFVRENNNGFKAGNLNNAFWQTDGDLLVILDADTRVFPDFLVHLTGYFRRKKMAWVQSPQWFYDISAGGSAAEWMNSRFPNISTRILKYLPALGSIRFGQNILGTEARIFYDSILRSRNAANAAFCCGAGSVHRRSALVHLIKHQSKRLHQLKSSVPLEYEKIKNKLLVNIKKYNGNVTGPFAHHISEDIYTSILLHSDSHKWESYQHPDVECKMLSPQSLPGYIKQFSRYAEGSYQIFFSKENPLIKSGLSIRQRLAYLETIFSYFSSFWIFIFLISPAVFYFTLTPPIKAFNFDFFFRFLLFNIFNIIIVVVGNWGLSTKRSEQYFIGSFWYKIKAFVKIISGATLKFNPTAKGISKGNRINNYKYVIPHLLIIMLTLIGFVYNFFLIVRNQHPSYSAFVANSAWALFNIFQLNAIIRAAFKRPNQ